MKTTKAGYARLAVAGVIIALGMSIDAKAADKWTPENTALEIGYNAMAFLDMRTTMDIKNHDDIIEVGYVASRVLGRNPEPLPTVAYFVGTSVLHYGVSRALPRGWREGWQVVTIGVEGGYALNNIRLGLNWSW